MVDESIPAMNMLAATVILAILALTASCWSQPPMRDELLATLQAKHLSLVEIGMFGKMQMLGLTDPVFKTRKLGDHSYVMGVSANGDRLLMAGKSDKNTLRPEINDEVDITLLNGETLVRVQPAIRGMLAISAELSPDGQSIAFGGNYASLTARAVFGLHLLTLSGEIRTLVQTDEPETPLSIGWSRDGQTIVYDRAGQVLLYHLKTNTTTVLAQGSRPAWSPDGLWIAYRRPDGSNITVEQCSIRMGAALDPGQSLPPVYRHFYGCHPYPGYTNWNRSHPVKALR
jgi:hypothetical protein